MLTAFYFNKKILIEDNKRLKTQKLDCHKIEKTIYRCMLIKIYTYIHI